MNVILKWLSCSMLVITEVLFMDTISLMYLHLCCMAYSLMPMHIRYQHALPDSLTFARLSSSTLPISSSFLSFFPSLLVSASHLFTPHPPESLLLHLYSTHFHPPTACTPPHPTLPQRQDCVATYASSKVMTSLHYSEPANLIATSHPDGKIR
jgi:hypothetical protein